MLPAPVKPETGRRKVELDSTTEALRSNPKPEIRNPKETRRPKSEAFGLKRDIWYSDFGLPSGFEFRVSDFGGCSLVVVASRPPRRDLSALGLDPHGHCPHHPRA